MKKCVFSMAIILMVVCMMSASGATLVFSSHGSSSNTANDAVTSNIGAGSVLQLTPNPGWYVIPTGTPWVSSWNSGDPSGAGYVQVPNGQVQNVTQAFVLPTGFNVTSAMLNFLADDSGWVSFNGHFVAAPTDLTPAPACVAGPPGCVLSTMWTGALNPAWFNTGMNSAVFSSMQLYGSSTGMSWTLTVNGSAPGQVPEPGTYALMGAGLGLLALLRRRKTA